MRPIETNFNPSSNRSVDNVVTPFITIHLLPFANAPDNAGRFINFAMNSTYLLHSCWTQILYRHQ